MSEISAKPPPALEAQPVSPVMTDPATAMSPVPSVSTPLPSKINVPLTYMQKVMIAVSVSLAAILLAIFIYTTAQILILCFAGVLMAVFLSAPSDLLVTYTGIRRTYALLIVLAALTLLALGGTVFAGRTIYRQSRELAETLPRAWNKFVTDVKQKYSTKREAPAPAVPALPTPVATTTAPATHTAEDDILNPNEEDPSNWVVQQSVHVAGVVKRYIFSESFRGAGGLVSSTFGILGNAAIVLGVGLFFAINPRMYVQGLIKLFPISRRPRTAVILSQVGTQLEWWFVAQLCSMASVGLLAFVGLKILGVPMAATLALMAGLMNFIPNFGPILAAAPAVLVALAPHGDQVALNWSLGGSVIGLYLVVQLLEGWVITPYFQSRAVELPAALIIISQVVFALLLGPLGLVLATPILAAVLVLVRMVYIEDVLGDVSDQSG